MKGLLFSASFGLCVAGCATEDPSTSIFEQSATVCTYGPTVKGIDVSYHNGTIDWNAVKGDGVEYAFIRVSDGATFQDPQFDTYWAGSRAAGIKHGVYQFFRPAEDPLAQANLLLTKIGSKLAVDDLPPVVDVEVSGSMPPATIQANLQKWIDRVTTVLGRPPIIYTAYNFWHDSVGNADFTPYPLWHAQYSSALYPRIADPWKKWYFWQYTESGTVAGITGGVDVNRWNGDKASLDAFIAAPVSEGSCGDKTCSAGECAYNCPEDCSPCGTIRYAGGIIDDGDACFEQGGPLEYMRKASSGLAGDLLWTHTSDKPNEGNYGTWHVFLDQAGRYKVQVYTDPMFAQSKTAGYVVHAGSSTTVSTIDQTAVKGWQSLGDFDFDAGGHQWIHLGDNTGEPGANNVQVAFDAVWLSRVGEGSGEQMEPEHGGCAVGGNIGFAMIAAFAGLRRRRRAA